MAGRLSITFHGDMQFSFHPYAVRTGSRENSGGTRTRRPSLNRIR